MWGLIIRGASLLVTNLLVTLFGEPMMRWLLFKFLNWLVKLTPMTWDDTLVKKLEDEYNKKFGNQSAP